MINVDSSLNHSRDMLAKARDAIEASDAGLLQMCVYSIDTETLCNEGEFLLELASGCGHSGCVKVLLECGCDPNWRCDGATAAERADGRRLSPLHIAAKNGHHG